MTVFQIENLSVRTVGGLFTAPRTIVANVSLTLAAREVVAILGRSGVGKTVFWRAMFGLSPSGLTFDFDRRMPALSESAFEAWRRSEVAFLHQGAQRCLDPRFSVADYLGHLFPRPGRIAARSRLRDAAAALGLQLGPTDLDRSIASFSGGESQRIALALRLAAEPRIMVLDEPSAALDFDAAERMKALVATVVERFGVSVICVTHDFHFISGLASRALYLAGGTASELDIETGRTLSAEAGEWLAISNLEAHEYHRYFGVQAERRPAMNPVPIRRWSREEQGAHA